MMKPLYEVAVMGILFSGLACSEALASGIKEIIVAPQTTAAVAPIPKLGDISFNAAGFAPRGVASMEQPAPQRAAPQSGTWAQAQEAGIQLANGHSDGEGFLRRLFDGRAGSTDETAVLSSRYLKVGGSLVDRRAPGAPALITALSFEPPRPVLGSFQPSLAAVFNGFAQGTEEVDIHIHALPGLYDVDDIGGYTLVLRRDGAWHVASSASVYSPITPAIARAVSRYFGLRPADETWAARLRRRLLDWVDAVHLLL